MARENGRSGTVEYVKFVGSLGIVWFHSGAPGGAYGYSALSLFTILLIFYLLKSASSISINDVIVSRTKRLMFPWIVWSLIFFMAKYADATLAGAELSSEFSYWMLMTGPALHLWFLPFSFVVSIILIAILKLFDGTKLFDGMNGTLVFAVICGLYVCTSLFSSYVMELYQPEIPFAQWLSVAPALMFGVILFWVSNKPNFLYSMLGVIFGLYILMQVYGFENLSLQIFIGSILSVAAVNISFQSTILSSSLAQISLGIYLLHPLVIALVSRMAADSSSLLILAIIVIPISCLIAYIISRTRYSRYLM